MAPTDESCDQKKLLKKISDQLTISDVGSMKFVCLDAMGAGLLDKISNAKPYQLFDLLEQKNYITLSDMSYLKDLFLRIQRSDLASQIPTPARKLGDIEDSGNYVPPMSPISPYRDLLMNIADELTRDSVDEIKFLLNIPRGRSSQITDGKDLLSHMEKDGKLSDTNFKTLRSVLEDVHRNDLIKEIDKFTSNCSSFNIPITPSVPPPPPPPPPPASRNQPQGNSFNLSGLPSLAPPPSPPPSALMRPSDFHPPPPPEEAPPHYPMKKTPFGYALIINNQTFTGRTEEGLILNERRGTELDLDNLKDLWEKLGFVVEHHTNLKAHRIVTVVQDMASKIDKDEVKPSCFVCCIMSHGKRGGIYGEDSKAVAMQDIIEFFKETKCRGLMGKPKLFFIQACRGQRKLTSVVHTGQQEIGVDSDAVPSAADDESFRRHVELDESHFLMGYSTLPGHVSWRSTQYGSWYVSAMVEIFDRFYQKEDLMTMMVRVNGKVSEAYTKQQYKQCPAPVITLTKRVYFHPN